MRTLLVLRHAKSSWDDARLDDFQRPLAPRGIKAARRMGRHMRDSGLVPERALASPAVRTRETIDIVRAELGLGEMPVDFDAALYLAEPAVLIARLQRVPAGVRRLLLVGHNPGLQELALLLIGEKRSPESDEIAAKFPTAALAAIRLDIADWSDVAPGCGRLTHYMTPRKLAGE